MLFTVEECEGKQTRKRNRSVRWTYRFICMCVCVHFAFAYISATVARRSSFATRLASALCRSVVMWNIRLKSSNIRIFSLLKHPCARNVLITVPYDSSSGGRRKKRTPWNHALPATILAPTCLPSRRRTPRHSSRVISNFSGHIFVHIERRERLFFHLRTPKHCQSGTFWLGPRITQNQNTSLPLLKTNALAASDQIHACIQRNRLDGVCVINKCYNCFLARSLAMMR